MKRVSDSAGIRRSDLRICQLGFQDSELGASAYIVVAVRSASGCVRIVVEGNDHVITVGSTVEKNAHERFIVRSGVGLLCHRTHQVEPVHTGDHSGPGYPTN